MNNNAQRNQGSRVWVTAQRTLLAAAMVTALGGCAWLGSSKAPKPADLGPNVVNLPVRQAWTLRVPSLKDALRVHVQGDKEQVLMVDMQR